MCLFTRNRCDVGKWFFAQDSARASQSLLDGEGEGAKTAPETVDLTSLVQGPEGRGVESSLPERQRASHFNYNNVGNKLLEYDEYDREW